MMVHSSHTNIDESLPLFGDDPSPGIVAVERFGESQVRIFRRHPSGELQSEIDTLRPWIVCTPEASRVVVGVREPEPLNGDAELSVRLRFDAWSTCVQAQRDLRDRDLPAVSIGSATEQYLIDSGRGLFRGMTFDQLVRAQIDIETERLDPFADDARIVLIACSINGERPVAFRGDELSESEILSHVTDWLIEHDPDVIEGHNLFNFDLPYIAERARCLRVSLNWGRDGSVLRIGGEQRFKAGARTIPYQSAFVYGRHLIDTYQQIQRYDMGNTLDSYALKPAIAALNLERSERTHVDASSLVATWTQDRERVIRYAIDDVLDVNTLSDLALPTEFYQTTLLPRSLQSVATGGPGEKVNDLLVRAYIARSESVPLPQRPREYPGGYAEVRHVGQFAPVVKCDVESLYPSIMLADDIRPTSDHLGVFTPMLSVLTRRRLAAKREEQVTIGREQAKWRGVQSSLKVLINSFYGYLGYGRGYFNDYDAARAVTLKGQRIVQHIVTELEARGATTIEVDTDGVFFRPPPVIQDEASEQTLIDDVSSALGTSFRLAHDGRYRGMLSLKLKNYALLGYDGRVILKGSSLRSRREELFLRRFLKDAVAHLLEPERHGDIRSFYLDVAESVMSGSLRPEEFSRSETITDQTFRSESTRRLATAVEGERVGERVLVYQREDGTLQRTDRYNNDEDRAYLLRRLNDMAQRFRPLYERAEDFDYVFPLVTLRTDIAALRTREPVRQLGLF